MANAKALEALPDAVASPLAADRSGATGAASFLSVWISNY